MLAVTAWTASSKEGLSPDASIWLRAGDVGGSRAACAVAWAGAGAGAGATGPVHWAAVGLPCRAREPRIFLCEGVGVGGAGVVSRGSRGIGGGVSARAGMAGWEGGSGLALWARLRVTIVKAGRAVFAAVGIGVPLPGQVQSRARGGPCSLQIFLQVVRPGDAGN
jgi:hypothetical protein